MIAAIVPAKALAQAKRRLAALLGEDERRRLAQAMLEDVLVALAAAPGLGPTAVISPDADILAQAQRLGVLPIAEPPTVRGLNQALAHALATLSAQAVDALLVVPADVPAITPDEATAIIDALPPTGPGVVLCPSIGPASPAGRRGTGAIALRPPDAIPFRFGHSSFTAHRREATARGIPVRVLRIPSLATDIDGPEDLLELLAHPADTATHRLLTDIGLADRLTPAARRPA